MVTIVTMITIATMVTIVMNIWGGKNMEMCFQAPGIGLGPRLELRLGFGCGRISLQSVQMNLFVYWHFCLT